MVHNGKAAIGRPPENILEHLIMKNILVLYYSRHGATKDMAQHIARGVNAVDGAEAKRCAP